MAAANWSVGKIAQRSGVRVSTLHFYEAKGLMKTAIRDNNPVIIFEDKLMYQDKAPVPNKSILFRLVPHIFCVKAVISRWWPRLRWCRSPKPQHCILPNRGCLPK